MVAPGRARTVGDHPGLPVRKLCCLTAQLREANISIWQTNRMHPLFDKIPVTIQFTPTYKFGYTHGPIKPMNTFRIISTVCVLVVSALLLKAEPDTSTPPTPKENLGYDIYNGKTNKIDRVMQVDPRYIWVLYENDSGSRRIPRNELPPTLAAKYPYDAQKASAYLQAKASENQAAINSQKALLQAQEKDVLAQVNALKKQQQDNDTKIKALTAEIKTAPKSKSAAGEKNQKVALLKSQEDMRLSMEKLQAKLKDVRSQIDALP